MKIKRIVTISILLAVFFSLSYFATIFLGKIYHGKKVRKVLIQAREAVEGLETVKNKGTTLVGEEYVINNNGAMDYVNNRFSITQTKDDATLSAIYYLDNTTYMYNGMLKSWIKFGEDLNMFSDILDKKKLTSAFPVDFKGTGFSIDIIGEEEIEGQQCYILNSVVVDKELAKKFMIKFLSSFSSKQVAEQLEKDKEAMEAYLEQYLEGSESTQWIAKDSFFVVKVINKNKQENAHGVEVFVENEAIYYDFNQPITIELPEDAKTAKLITAKDIGLGE